MDVLINPTEVTLAFGLHNELGVSYIGVMDPEQNEVARLEYGPPGTMYLYPHQGDTYYSASDKRAGDPDRTTLIEALLNRANMTMIKGETRG